MHSNHTKNELLAISGADIDRCMKCGRCSASCPSHQAMDIRPHQFVSYAADGRVDALLECNSLWQCLSCFACIQRCPRDVKPAQLIEAARLMVIRQQGENYIDPDEIPGLLNNDVPQQLLVSAFRKYRK
ncbi:MAG: 4Fe-4S dicluster domain-containing protein [Defluviitaleaceae bacterium]|nr:4Fe-4S dicluster domain-containing protein [Defluviitaleaceae bacterium]